MSNRERAVKILAQVVKELGLPPRFEASGAAMIGATNAIKDALDEAEERGERDATLDMKPDQGPRLV
jgi:hypothetical protein